MPVFPFEANNASFHCFKRLQPALSFLRYFYRRDNFLIASRVHLGFVLSHGPRRLLMYAESTQCTKLGGETSAGKLNGHSGRGKKISCATATMLAAVNFEKVFKNLLRGLIVYFLQYCSIAILD
jgi:hypothetical protein